MGDSKNRFLAPAEDSHGDDPVIVAHRGDSFRAPENTLEAARLAWEAGADCLGARRSVDPRRRPDRSCTMNRCSARPTSPRGSRTTRGPTAVFASPTLISARFGPSTPAPGSLPLMAGHAPRVAFGTLDQLEPASIAHYRSRPGDDPHAGRGTPLDERARLAGERRDQVVPREPAGPGRTGARGHRPRPARHRGRLISSFDHSDVATANRPGRAYALGILTMTPLYRTHDYATELVGADTVHVSTEVLGSESIAYRRQPAARSLRTDLIAELKKHDIPILVYTVNDHGQREPRGTPGRDRRRWPVHRRPAWAQASFRGEAVLRLTEDRDKCELSALQRSDPGAAG